MNKLFEISRHIERNDQSVDSSMDMLSVSNEENLALLEIVDLKSDLDSEVNLYTVAVEELNRLTELSMSDTVTLAHYTQIVTTVNISCETLGLPAVEWLSQESNDVDTLVELSTEVLGDLVKTIIDAIKKLIKMIRDTVRKLYLKARVYLGNSDKKLNELIKYLEDNPDGNLNYTFSDEDKLKILKYAGIYLVRTGYTLDDTFHGHMKNNMKAMIKLDDATEYFNKLNTVTIEELTKYLENPLKNDSAAAISKIKKTGDEGIRKMRYLNDLSNNINAAIGNEIKLVMGASTIKSILTDKILVKAGEPPEFKLGTHIVYRVNGTTAYMFKNDPTFLTTSLYKVVLSPKDVLSKCKFNMTGIKFRKDVLITALEVSAQFKDLAENLNDTLDRAIKNSESLLGAAETIYNKKIADGGDKTGARFIFNAIREVPSVTVKRMSTVVGEILIGNINNVTNMIGLQKALHDMYLSKK